MKIVTVPLDAANAKFRRAYIIHQANFDFSGLRDVCQDLRVVVTGMELPEELPSVIQAHAITFDPEQDLLVPVGNVYSNFLAGAIFTRSILEAYPLKVTSIFLAAFRDKQYHYQQVVMEPLQFNLFSSRWSSYINGKEGTSHGS